MSPKAHAGRHHLLVLSRGRHKTPALDNRFLSPPGAPFFFLCLGAPGGGRNRWSRAREVTVVNRLSEGTRGLRLDHRSLTSRTGHAHGFKAMDLVSLTHRIGHGGKGLSVGRKRHGL